MTHTRAPNPSVLPAPASPIVVRRLGDLTPAPRPLFISALAVLIGGLSAGVAWAVLRLIGLITNLVFYGRVATSLVAPASAHAGPG
jgi:hypothetical protein